MVCTETPAASAISAWLMQPATRSVAVLKSMTAVYVGIDIGGEYITLYTDRAKSKAGRFSRQEASASPPRTDPEAARFTKASPAGRRGSSPLEVHDGRHADRGARRLAARRV